MRRLFAAFSRYRPRVLTLVVLAAIAALLWLANLSEEYSPRKLEKFPLAPADLKFEVGETEDEGGCLNMSYGWPLRWRQYVIRYGMGLGVIGECASTARLAGNLAIWLVMLAAPAGLCEWLVRRYRPRLRFSLRTMLVATGLAAAMLGWFVAARNRVNVQESLVGAIKERHGRVWVERGGPKWLDLVGADRYCRWIVGAELDSRLIAGDGENEREEQRLFDELKRLPDLRYLSLVADRLTPEMADALSEMRRVETLQIEIYDLTDSAQALGRALRGMKRLRTLDIGRYARSFADPAARRHCLAAVGKLPQLERLRLRRWEIGGQDLALLAGLGNLKSLTLCDIFTDPDGSEPDSPLLLRLPRLPRLETLDLQGSAVGNADLRYVAALSRLKSLSLFDTSVTDAGLTELAPLESLEELAIDFDVQTLAGFEALLQFKRLKRLHLDFFDADSLRSPDALREELEAIVLPDEVEASMRAIEALRNSNPGLVVDDDAGSVGWDDRRITPKRDPDLWLDTLLREAVQAWKEKQAGK